MNLEREINDIQLVPIMPSLAEWLQLTLSRKPEPHLVENILPHKAGEYCIIAGRTGIGKTAMALNLAFCLARGTPFLKFGCQKCVVGILALEGDERNFAERLQKLGAVFPLPNNNLRFALIEPDRPERVLKKIAELSSGLRVLIIDGARYIIPGDYCSPKDARSFIVYLKRMLREKGISAILTLQLSKPSNRTLSTGADIYRVKGATELVDDATSVMLIERVPWGKSNDLVVLSFVKHRISRDELLDLSLSYERETCLFRDLGN